MKKTILCMLAILLAFAPVTAFASTIEVLAGAALEGNFGMRLNHDTTSVAYVEDQTPAGEPIYRAEFLFRPTAFNTNNTNVRQTIFRTISTNPGPGQFGCSQAAFVTHADIFIYWIVNGQLPFATAFQFGRGCNPAAVGSLVRLDNQAGGVDTNGDGAVRFCFQWEEGASGLVRFGVTDDVNACTAATFQEINRDTAGMTVETARLGNAQVNGFGAGETATLDYDSFASFRATAN